MSVLNPAPHVDAALNALDLRLQDRITAFNSVAGNPQLTLPPVLPAEDAPLSGVASGRAFYFGGRETHYVFPAIEIASTEDDTHDASLEQLAWTEEPRVLVVVWVQDKTVALPALSRQMYGYSQVVGEVLLRPNAFGPGVIVKRVRSRWRSPDPELRRFEYLTLTALHLFHLEDEEERPR